MVAATRSRVSEAFGVPPPRKTAAEARLGGNVDQSCTSPLSSCLDRKNKSRRNNIKLHPICGGATGGQLKSKLRSGKANSGFKDDHKAPVELSGISIVTSRADGDQLLRQTTREDYADLENPPLSKDLSTKTSSESTKSPVSLSNFGMYAGRVKANPLKYLATVLRSKMRTHDEACNLLEVATEIHDEAKNKHNTTLRRIYDVVNVLEAAGLLERSNGNTPSKRLPGGRSRYACPNPSNTMTENVSAECPKSTAIPEEDFIKCHVDQVGECSRNLPSHASKPDTLEKRSTRGSKIRWLCSQSENEESCNTQTLDCLAKEKIATTERISEKQHEFEFLQEELRLTTELIKHNQDRKRLSDSFQSHINACAPSSEDLSCSSYLNFEECSETSVETERNQDFKDVISDAAHASAMSALSSSLSREFDPGLNNPPMVTEEDLNFSYNQLVDETELTFLEAAEQYQSYGLPLTTTGLAVKGLHVPFVILQTNNATNVDIQLDENVTREVYFALDNEYQLFDYRELLSFMFVRHDGYEPSAIDTN